MASLLRRSTIRAVFLNTAGALLIGGAAWLPPQSKLTPGAFPAELAGLYRIEPLSGTASSETVAFLRVYPNGRLRLEGLHMRTVDGQVVASSIVEPGLARWHVAPTAFGGSELCVTRRSGAKCARLVRDGSTGDLVWGGPRYTGAATHQRFVKQPAEARAPGSRAT